MINWCDHLSRSTGRSYRLPSEAEWEYACRAGTTTPFHFGETITTDLANYQGTENEEYKWSGSYGAGPEGTYRGETTEVGSFGVANTFGLLVFGLCAVFRRGLLALNTLALLPFSTVADLNDIQSVRPAPADL